MLYYGHCRFNIIKLVFKVLVVVMNGIRVDSSPVSSIMVLEASVIMYSLELEFCAHDNLIFAFSIDNSEWTRNGDYAPSRLDASKEAANCLASRKLADNVENCVGIMTMGGLK
jgi:hypothetical protein